MVKFMKIIEMSCNLCYTNSVVFQFVHSRDTTEEIIIKNVENLSL